MCGIDVKYGVRTTLQRIEKVCTTRGPEFNFAKPRLVAVSKTNPVHAIIDAYEEGVRHFGENYIQELTDKATSEEILKQCKDIRWHLVGHLQSNKINKVLAIPNLYMIETVDSKRLASMLNHRWPSFGPPNTKLKIMLQVNTSDEDEKNGIDPKEVGDLTKHILATCDNLEFDGLMTIGRFNFDPTEGPNPDFICLNECRTEISQRFSISYTKINLSMGMSTDFEQAIEMGSTHVRIGRTIFGARPPKNAT